MALAWARASLFCSSSLRWTIWSSAEAFLSAGSHFTASLRSRAAFDHIRILASAKPRRAVAFPWNGSKRSASVQSMAASRHSSSFSSARARFARHAVLTAKASVSWPTQSAAWAASLPLPVSGGSYFSRRSSAAVYVATASRKRPSAKYLFASSLRGIARSTGDARRPLVRTEILTRGFAFDVLFRSPSPAHATSSRMRSFSSCRIAASSRCLPSAASSSFSSSSSTSNWSQLL
mmetsp:Transcript_3965/g.10720  ORF Transcript_3965/g.10720 Transcript_3965/m.10720 type:complete len:234 (-) Transcript_3965:407-1108(-)